MVQKIKVISIIGNRPQFIKLAPLANEFKKNKKKYNHIIINTNQHFDLRMSDIFFKELNIQKAKYNLGIGGGTHGQNTGRMIEKCEKILLKENPHFVVVFGDTDTTLAASIAAIKIKINLIHIEAGLRSFDQFMPEEINRKVVDCISTINCTPTKNATDNLINENISRKSIFKTGDIMYDSILQNINSDKVLFYQKLHQLSSHDYVFLTIHRSENTLNQYFIKLVLKELSKNKSNLIYWPIHPRVNKLINKYNIKFPSNIIKKKPLSYFETLAFLKNSRAVITDSGGLQKEAYFIGIPSIVLRNKTEWIELLKNKSSLLCKDIKKINLLITKIRNKKIKNKWEFGNGSASKKIIKIIKKNFNR